MDMDKNLLYYMWLNSKIHAGSTAPKTLLEYYGDIEKVYQATYEDYTTLGISNKEITQLCDKSLDDAKRYYEFCAKEHIGVLCYDNPYYPGRLKCISDPPPMFYYKGRVEMLDDQACFAMVGTRSCSEKGLRYSYRLGYKAASRGAVVLNGIAKGCDSAALYGALDADGYAVAILGSGIDRIYPPENKELFKKVEASGLILTEFPPFSKPDGKNFPVRNRVMSGLTLGTVILEADSGSGALITASKALSQGKKIYALPGDITNRLYEGPLQFIKTGAKLITDADDFVMEYALMFPHRINAKKVKIEIPKEKENAFIAKAFVLYGKPKHTSEDDEKTLPKQKKSVKKAELTTPKQESKPADIQSTTSDISESRDYSALSVPEQVIMELFEKNETLSADEIAAKGFKVDDVLSSLTMLEIYGYISALPGGRYKIVD